MVVPRAEVDLLGNWDVLGLRATNSYDYRIDTDVPAHATFEFFSPTRYRGGPMYDLGVIILTEMGHTGWTMGVIRRAVDEAVAIARGRSPHGRAVGDPEGSPVPVRLRHGRVALRGGRDVVPPCVPQCRAGCRGRIRP